MRKLITAALLLASAAVPAAAVPPGFTMERTGSVKDFDYFRGGWETVQHKLASGAGASGKWDDFPGRLCMRPYLDGGATVDELDMPTRGISGLTLRTFDKVKRQWSIYWVSSTSGRLDPVPVVGGFTGRRGEFYAEDRIGERPVKVRYLWLLKDRDHARWEQALSFDNASWVTNWTADFRRADASKVCSEGRPIRGAARASALQPAAKGHAR